MTQDPELFERFAAHVLSLQSVATSKRQSCNLQQKYPHIDKFLSTRCEVIPRWILFDFVNSPFGQLARARATRKALEAAGFHELGPEFENFRKFYPNDGIQVFGEFAVTDSKLCEVNEALSPKFFVDLSTMLPKKLISAVMRHVAVDETRFAIFEQFVVSRRFIYEIEDGKASGETFMFMPPSSLIVGALPEAEDLKEVGEVELKEKHRKLRHALEVIRILNIGKCPEIEEYTGREMRSFIVDIVDYRLHGTVDKKVKFVLETDEAMEKAFRLLNVTDKSEVKKLFTQKDYSNLKECLEEAGITAYPVKQDKLYIKEKIAKLKKELNSQFWGYRETLASLRILEKLSLSFQVSRPVLSCILAACMQHGLFSETDLVLIYQ